MKKGPSIIAFFFIFLPMVFAFGAEVIYPPAPGATTPTTESLLPDYVKYIFNLAIASVGIIAFGVLVFAGFRYYTSAGKPEIIKSARNQIKSAFLGILILLFSWIILTTINPQLIILELPGKKDIEIPVAQDEPIVVSRSYTNPLWRITEIANSVKNEIAKREGIKISAKIIKNLTDKCNCDKTWPMCLCQDYRNGACESLYCYSQDKNQPCPDDAEIKANQQTIIASMSEIIYYKNRAVSEREDFLIDIEDFNKLISYYEEKIEAETKFLSQIQGEDPRQLQQELIDKLVKTKDKLKNEQTLYQNLTEKLKELSDLIQQIAIYTDKISKLPDECLLNVKDKCQGGCEEGCHDKRWCKPSGPCSGGNPCPTDKIEAELNNINSLGDNIKNVSDDIIKTVNDIIILINQ